MSLTQTLSVSHEIFVPREIVFEAWTNPDHLMGWYSPGEGYERRAIVDLRPGGRMHFAWCKPGGERVEQDGEIVAVEPPARIVYEVQIQDGEADIPDRVTINFVDLGGRTRIEIDQKGPASESMRRRQVEHWQLLFEQFERYLSSI